MAENPLRSGRMGIVTVLYGSRDVVDGFFDSLALQQDVDFKLYVIDNSPDRDTLDRCELLARERGIEAEFVFNNRNAGVARGNNQGIELALRDGCVCVLLANNDTEFTQGTLQLLMDEWRSGAHAVTPKLLYSGPERLIWYAGGRIDAWTLRTPHLGMREVDRGQFDRACITGYAPTCFLLVDSGVFDAVGLMDESYFVYYDDTDFIWRLWRAGLEVRYAPQAVVLHYVSTSTGGGESPFTAYYSNRNRVYFIRKNFRGLQRLVALVYVLSTRLPAAVQLPAAAAKRLWTGVRDGLRMPVASDRP